MTQTEPDPSFTLIVDCVELAQPETRVIDIETLQKLRDAAIATVRQLDLAIYGRADKTIPIRRL